MSHVINEYSLVTRGAGETQEWHLVLQEISLFLQEDLTVNVKHPEFKPQPRRTVFPSRPLPALPGTSGPALRLQSCILVGCHQHQVKFSELTLDMYRMMYALERDPASALAASGGSSSSSSTGGNASSGANSGGLTPRSKAKALGNSNPKKFLLYRPTVSQVLLYIASAQRELLENGTLLLYVSADGEAAKSSNVSSSSSTPMANHVPPVSPASLSLSTGSGSIPPSPAGFTGLHFSGSMASSTSSLINYLGPSSNTFESYGTGGVRLKREDVAASRNGAAPNARNRAGSYSAGSSASAVARASSYVSSSALYPADIVPFTRRPTFLIVESDNSHAFLSLGSSNGTCPFAAPLLVLCSPQETPTDVLEGSQAGGLFSFYLHDPLAAFLFTSNKTVSTIDVYDKALAQVKSITLALDDLFSTSPDLRTYSITQFSFYLFYAAEISSSLPNIGLRVYFPEFHHSAILDPNLHQSRFTYSNTLICFSSQLLHFLNSLETNLCGCCWFVSVSAIMPSSCASRRISPWSAFLPPILSFLRAFCPAPTSLPCSRRLRRLLALRTSIVDESQHYDCSSPSIVPNVYIVIKVHPLSPSASSVSPQKVKRITCHRFIGALQSEIECMK